jgi:hypothetical protein
MGRTAEGFGGGAVADGDGDVGLGAGEEGVGVAGAVDALGGEPGHAGGTTLSEPGQGTRLGFWERGGVGNTDEIEA